VKIDLNFFFKENDEQIVKKSEEYISFPETPSPKQQIVGDIEKEIGFFGRFASHLTDSAYNSIDLLKMLSDGIADLLFTGSNRLETRTEVNKIDHFHIYRLFSSARRIKLDCIYYELIKI
jgi:hypothetical protein